VKAATDVWLFYGWGPDGWSSGIDQIARRVRTLRGVETVHVSDYRDTQAAYDFLRQTRPEHAIAVVGYSCGGNAALAVGGALTRTVHVIALQPSVWCGRYGTTPNMRYFQDTWSGNTFGLGSYQPEPLPAHYTTFIERPNPHGAADTDPLYQRDAVFAVGAVADPARSHLLTRHFVRTAPHVDRQDAQVIWRRE
jgi:acetyl esterase/lipase